MFVRASRNIAKDSRFTNKEWRRLTRFDSQHREAVASIIVAGL